MKINKKLLLNHLRFNIQKSSFTKGKLELYGFVFIIVLGFSIYAFIPEVQFWTNNSFQVLLSNDKYYIKEWINAFGWVGPIILIVAMIGQMFLMIIPTTLILVVCILAYGPIWGSILGLLAIYLASSAGYLIGRTFGSNLVEKFLGSKIKTKTHCFLEKYGFWAIFMTRLNPFLSNDVISIIGGMARMNYWHFTTASLMGITPLILSIAIFGETSEGLTGLLIGSCFIFIIFCLYEFLLPKRLHFNGSERHSQP